MNFTREDILKIWNALLQLGRKDSEFKEANTPLSSDDYIAILLDGINKKVSINNLLSTLGLLKKDDFINVSDRYDEYYIQLSEAITIIANNKRKKGLVITFQDINGSWRIYQFNDEISNFIKTEYWKDLFDFKYNIVNSVLPDEEDLTLTLPNIEGNSFIQLKDKEYDPQNFSGMATKILRKNIVEVNGVKKNILTLGDFDLENCIYEIRYDFTLTEDITIPANCVLKFDGGSISGEHTLIGTDTIITASPIKIFGTNVIIAGTWNVKAYIEWFGAVGDSVTDDSYAMTACLPFKNIELQSKTYLIKMVDIVLDNTHIWGIGNATVYNDEWGPWSFRTSCNYIEIDHINFKAIPHIQVIRTFPGDEYDNGASAILAKGSYCSFHDLYIEEFYAGIWLGGDYLDDEHLQHRNIVYNIKCHNINFNCFAWQKDLVVYDISGDYARFTKESYDGTTEGESNGNPGHLVYLTGHTYNITCYNITGNYEQGSGSVLSVKGVTEGFIHDIVAFDQNVIQSDNCVRVNFVNISVNNPKKDGAYVLDIRTANNCYLNNIIILSYMKKAIFRVAYCDNIHINNTTVGVFGQINDSEYVLNLSNSNNVIIENSYFPSTANDKDTRYWLNPASNTVFRNVKYDGSLENAKNIKFESCNNLILQCASDINSSVDVTDYKEATQLPGYTDRHAFEAQYGRIREYIVVSDNLQVVFFNIGKISSTNKEYIIINAGSAAINIRFTDISESQIVHSNYTDYASYPLAAGKVIKLQLNIINVHVIINKTDLFT